MILETPREKGYRMPAEWEKHEATWLAWPHSRLHNYWSDRLGGVEDIYIKMIGFLKDSELVKLLVFDFEMEKYVKGKLMREKVGLEHVTFYHIETSDVWMRDYGPIFLVNEAKQRKKAMTHWIFNGWGGKYLDLLGDTSVPARIHQMHGKIPYYHGGLVLEGGAIEVNGKGILITTKSCLLNSNRNPRYACSEIENRLKEYLGVEKIIWLSKGLVNDDTDGHVDNLVRFVNEQTVVCSSEDVEIDGNYRRLRSNLKVMKEELNEKGVAFERVNLPLPYFRDEKKRLAASYANFYIANTKVIVPTFGDRQSDERAVSILRDLFSPQREVVSINCVDLIYSGGTIHCITQQEPL